MPTSTTRETRTPVNLLTGFLGSGKTTLLNGWLRDPAMADAAVIVNEFGEIGIDHSLIASSNDHTIELTTGCLCCTVRGDLVETLRDLHERRRSGEIREFSRVLIETTGLADPVPVIQALITFPVARVFRLGRVITVVDAVNGSRTLDAHVEAVRQVLVADELIASKTDLAATTDALFATLRRLNPAAGFIGSSEKAPPPATVLEGADIYDPSSRPAMVREWLKADRYDGHDHHHDVNRHCADIGGFCFTFDEPLHWEHVSAWLDALVMVHGDALLRVKGILQIVGRPRPIVLQAVQRLFHPPAELPDWPDGLRRSQIVFITRGLSREFVLEVFETLRQRVPLHGASVN